MHMLDIIEKKRDGGKLNREEIVFFVRGCTEEIIPDYQIAALLMAVYLNGMDHDEAYHLTEAMAATGEQLDIALPGIKADKHSSGGVGDKTTLIVAPVVSCFDIFMPKMSGRGLGHTGGTIDKLEAIPGFTASLSAERFASVAKEAGFAVAGQTGNLAPADKKLYALRDVTGTVGSIPLIASSIMSKKLVSGNDILVLDVKVGSGAFMKTLEEARQLAKLMVQIGKRHGKKTAAVLSDMDKPLGYAVGNAIETAEAVQVLKSRRQDSDIERLSCVLAGQILKMAGKASSLREGENMARDAIRSGNAWGRFQRWAVLQGGDIEALEALENPCRASGHMDICAPDSGCITAMDCEAVGRAAMLTGAGREKKNDAIDPFAGLLILKKTGDCIEKGDVLAKVLYNGQRNEEEIKHRILQAYTIGEGSVKERPLIYEIIE